MQGPATTTIHHVVSHLRGSPEGPAFKRAALLLAAIVSVLAFCWLAQEAAIEGDYIAIEAQWMAIVFSWRNPAMDHLMLWYTKMHDYFMVAFIMGFIGLHAYQRRWQDVKWFVAVVPGGMLANIGLKGIFQRSRPEFDAMVHAHGYSFPSGHSVAASLVAGWLIYATFLWTRNVAWRFASVTAGVSIAVGVAFSRVYLGVHYPMDVAAGVLAGSVWILICLSLYSFSEGEAPQ